MTEQEMNAYAAGFAETCASMGVDPEALLKQSAPVISGAHLGAIKGVAGKALRTAKDVGKKLLGDKGVAAVKKTTEALKKPPAVAAGAFGAGTVGGVAAGKAIERSKKPKSVGDKIKDRFSSAFKRACYIEGFAQECLARGFDPEAVAKSAQAGPEEDEERESFLGAGVRGAGRGALTGAGLGGILGAGVGGAAGGVAGLLTAKERKLKLAKAIKLMLKTTGVGAGVGGSYGALSGAAAGVPIGAITSAMNR